MRHDPSSNLKDIVMMTRRQMAVTTLGGLATALTGATVLRAAKPPVPADWARLDRLPDTPEVENAGDVAVLLVHGKTKDYGAQMRILSKSLGVLNAGHAGRDIDLSDTGGSGVAEGVVAVVAEIRRRGLGYDQNVRALTRAMGVLSEEHRVAS